MIKLNLDISFRGLSPQQESIVQGALQAAAAQFVKEVVDEVGWEDSRRFSKKAIEQVKSTVLVSPTKG